MNLVQEIHAAGIILSMDGDKIRYQAPPGAMSPGLRDSLSALKSNAGKLVEYYCSRPRPERLAMHKRGVALSKATSAPLEFCELQAYREAWEAAGSPPGPFEEAKDWLVDK